LNFSGATEKESRRLIRASGATQLWGEHIARPNRRKKVSWFEIATDLEPYLRKGDLNFCIDRVSNIMRDLPQTPFHQIINLEFTNDPKDVVEYFEKFIEQESGRYEIKAIYTETNGFYINPDRWFFELFAYETYGGHEDYDWLADWRSGDYPSMTLTGMERLQRVYGSDAFHDGKYKEESGYCSLLVVLNFQNL
jgi:hypothetical protein